MAAISLVAEPVARRRHASREEYFTWLDSVVNAGIRARGQAHAPQSNPAATSTTGSSNTGPTWRNGSLRHCWPGWIWARTVLRPGQAAGKWNGPSCETGPYLIYMSMVQRMPMDADYVMGRNFDSLLGPRSLRRWASTWNCSACLTSDSVNSDTSTAGPRCPGPPSGSCSGKAIRTSPRSPMRT